MPRGAKEVHGHAKMNAKSKTYIAWRNMLARCDNPDYKGFAGYGGRGITYTPSWRQFDIFLVDMGECPSGQTLERKNNDKGYSKQNCKWASRLEQGRNTRRIKLTLDKANEIRQLRKDGLTMKQIAEQYRVGLSTVANVLYNNSWRNK